MKKTLLILSIFSVIASTIYEKVEALKLENIFTAKKSPDGSTNAFHEIARRTELMSASLDNLIKENLSSGADVTLLSGLVIFIRNISTLFDWLNNSINELKSCLEKIQQAQSEEEEQELAAAKELAKKKIQIFLGNSTRSLRANVKASATIYMKMIQSLRFSNIGMDTLGQDMSNLVEQCGRIRTAKQLLTKTINNIFKAMEEDLEESLENELNQLMADITSFVDVLDKINTYFTEKALPPEDIDKLLETCSLVNQAEETNLNETDADDEDAMQSEEDVMQSEEENEESDEEETKPKKEKKKKKKKAKNEDTLASPKEEEENTEAQDKKVKKKAKKKKKKKQK
ncbi:MAG: hypothetical protein LBF44_02175 [Holosporaceae bacterium]|jgi:hypothetical protein|nr:hypothetical protein [Holosporaceae bacterium]